MSHKIDIKEIQRVENCILRDIISLCDENGIEYYLVCGSALGAIRHKGQIPWDTDIDMGVPYEELYRVCDLIEKKYPDKYFAVNKNNEKNYGDFAVKVCVKGMAEFEWRTIHVDIFPFVGLPNDRDEQLRFSDVSTEIRRKYKIKTKSKPSSKNIIKRLIGMVYFPLRKLSISESKIKLEEAFDSHCREYPYATAEFVMNPCGHYGAKNIIPKAWLGKGQLLPYENMSVKVPEKLDEYLTNYYGKKYMTPQKKENETDNFVLVVDFDTSLIK